MNTIKWAVNGFYGGTGSTGPISLAGVYLPAPTIFAGHSVKITATTMTMPAMSSSLTVWILNPLPHLTSGSVTQSVAGGPFLLDVLGSDFVSGSQLQIAGNNVPTLFVSSQELQSTVPLAVATTTIKVGVLNPNAEQASPVAFESTLQPARLAMIVATPASVSFGEVTLNTASTQTVILSSTGTESATITSASLSGAGLS